MSLRICTMANLFQTEHLDWLVLEETKARERVTWKEKVQAKLLSQESRVAIDFRAAKGGAREIIKGRGLAPE